MNRTALITGAGSGIGAATALKLAENHQTLILHTRSNKKGLEELAELCQQKGAQCHLLLADLSVAAERQVWLSEIQSQFPQIDSIVHNAGFPDWRSTGELDLDGLAKSVEVIQMAFFDIITALLANLQKSPYGRVLSVSSFLAHKFKVGNNFVPASATAKAGLEALTRSMAAQFAPEGITVNCIVPGYIKKNAPDHQAPSEEVLNNILNRIPAGRLGLPAEVAELMDFLISEKASYITGQLIHIDGGLCLG